MNEPLVHVLVINWNGREHLVDCFDSLLTSSYQNAKFVLVDNGSEDDSIALVEARFGHDARVSILPCTDNIGWSGGNNVGIRYAQEHGADYIFLLNNDTAVAPDCIERLVATMEAHPEYGALAPRMLLFDQPCLLNSVGLEMSVIGAAWDRGIGRADSPAWHEPVPVVGACGGACFLRASVLEQTGLLPEEFEIYLDDLDLCLRIWNAGFSVQTFPDAPVRPQFSAPLGEG
ncbi:MAG: glycosyltransferase family 2 protein, partial [Candidatus Hydrogenedentes bacterium]|nr:glycosyltransferase family 2 protein [Candidatus Hydrogenedentota bacterium]